VDILYSLADDSQSTLSLALLGKKGRPSKVGGMIQWASNSLRGEDSGKLCRPGHKYDHNAGIDHGRARCGTFML
jgi:hypothetical protein